MNELGQQRAGGGYEQGLSRFGEFVETFTELVVLLRSLCVVTTEVNEVQRLYATSLAAYLCTDGLASTFQRSHLG